MLSYEQKANRIFFKSYVRRAYCTVRTYLVLISKVWMNEKRKK
jgi:hypothetical protein